MLVAFYPEQVSLRLSPFYRLLPTAVQTPATDDG